MQLKNLLEQKKAAVIKQWFDLVVETYPAETSRILKNHKDPFANPVGSTTLSGVETLYDELLHGMAAEAINAALDPIIRIRAVQNFTPSQAVGFIFALKAILRRTIAGEEAANGGEAGLVALEADIDRLGLMAFDIYMRCREKIYDLMANETKNRTFRAFQRAGLITETPENGSAL